MYESRTSSPMRRPLTWAVLAAVVLIVGAAAWHYIRQSPGEGQQAKTQQAPPVVPAPSEPAIRHPLPADTGGPQESAEPLPALNDSDAAIQDGLGEVVGPEAVREFAKPENVIRNIVVTIDNLPRKKAAVERRPVKAISGQPIVIGSGDVMTLSEESYTRYDGFVKLVQAADARALAAVYFRFYPLFQQAYEDLGYPDRYFNDRVIEVIDHLLDAPDVRGPIELVQPNVFYEFADPRLEARSAGQKTLVRMGGRNAGIIKEKLREIRRELVGRQ